MTNLMAYNGRSLTNIWLTGWLVKSPAELDTAGLIVLAGEVVVLTSAVAFSMTAAVGFSEVNVSAP